MGLMTNPSSNLNVLINTKKPTKLPQLKKKKKLKLKHVQIFENCRLNTEMTFQKKIWSHLSKKLNIGHVRGPFYFLIESFKWVRGWGLLQASSNI